MYSEWTFVNAFPEEQVQQLASQLSLPPIIARILLNRGIESLEDARFFFRAGLDHLYDPFLMADMTKAVDTIQQAIEKRKKILEEITQVTQKLSRLK